MPCTAKQELKRAFHIPIQEQIDKPNQTNICTVTIEGIATKTIATFEQANNLRESKIAHAALIVQTCVYDNPQRSFYATVPIYILHEQYLI